MHLLENLTFFHNPSSNMRTLRALKIRLKMILNWKEEIFQGLYTTLTFIFPMFVQDAFSL